MQAGQQQSVSAGSGLSATSTNPVEAANAGLFSAALAQNAGINARVRLPEAIAAGRSCNAILRSIRVTSFDQLDWEFWIWRNKNFQVPGVDATAEQFAGFWSFSVGSGDGKRIAGTGLYYYYIDGLGIPYTDLDAHNAPSEGGFLNVTLVNRSAGAKTAAAWFGVEFVMEPSLGW